MGMMSIFNVSGSAASAQSQRLNVVASNLANADTVAGPDGSAYKARQVTFQTQLMGATGNDPAAAGVRVSTIAERNRDSGDVDTADASGADIRDPNVHRATRGLRQGIRSRPVVVSSQLEPMPSRPMISMPTMMSA